MFIAMNRFRVKRGAEGAFEKVWVSRDSYLDRVPGFVEFHLLKGPEAEDHTLYASHTVWRAKPTLRRGPNRRSSALRTRAPATKRPGHSIWSIPNLRASRYDRRSLARRWPHNEVPTASARPRSGGEDGPPQCVFILWCRDRIRGDRRGRPSCVTRHTGRAVLYQHPRIVAFTAASRLPTLFAEWNPAD